MTRATYRRRMASGICCRALIVVLAAAGGANAKVHVVHRADNWLLGEWVRID